MHHLVYSLLWIQLHLWHNNDGDDDDSGDAYDGDTFKTVYHGDNASDVDGDDDGIPIITLLFT
jgi:hypothetical protein